MVLNRLELAGGWHYGVYTIKQRVDNKGIGVFSDATKVKNSGYAK